ncbi:KRE2 [Candida margitis]|uniref:KRE2 n=1 Tax=Candida margitis TaxID=1775924 RepID=UPI00222602C0|nr:KRE2 [Candida margitis]KAI5967341.1 KRE2 [Candida margitis]
MKGLTLFGSRSPYLKYVAVVLTVLVIYTLTQGATSYTNINQEVQKQQQPQQQASKPSVEDVQKFHDQVLSNVQGDADGAGPLSEDERKAAADEVKEFAQDHKGPVQDARPLSEDERKAAAAKVKEWAKGQQGQQGQDKPQENLAADKPKDESSQLVASSDTKVKATFVTLARNKELFDLIKSIRVVEDRFNRKFNYDWVFLNDEEFTQEFKDLTTAIVSGKTKYGKIPTEHWSYPEWVNLDKAAESRKKMKQANIIYGDSESYRHMCRFESGFFWRNPLLDDYEWYWRVEPGIEINCDLNYDLFKYMQDNDKVYGFTISIHEFEKTIPTLWQHTKDFIEKNPQYVAKDNFLDFISDDGGKTYNLCHFWSNFEIANLNFWRSDAYRAYFDYLDSTGGFFYERWGDAPVHSIAAALFLPKSKIHYFEDVGYRHHVYGQCPLNPQFRYEHKCSCNPNDDFTFRGYSCGKKYYEKMGLTKPAEWQQYQ